MTDPTRALRHKRNARVFVWANGGGAGEQQGSFALSRRKKGKQSAL